MLCEGANMPCDPDAIEAFEQADILYGPSKAANAGGVAVSGLEMAQNAQLTHWDRERLDGMLQDIMRQIHRQCVEAAEEYGHAGKLLVGANIAGFRKVAESMLDQGLV